MTLPVYLVDLSCVRRNAHLNNASRAVPESKSVVKSTLDQQLRRVVKNINITCGVVESKPFAHKLMANLLQPAYTSTLSLFHRYEGNANYTVLKPPSIWSDILSPAGLDCNSS